MGRTLVGVGQEECRGEHLPKSARSSRWISRAIHSSLQAVSTAGAD